MQGCAVQESVLEHTGIQNEFSETVLVSEPVRLRAVLTLLMDRGGRRAGDWKVLPPERSVLLGVEMLQVEFS